jgi:N utilization substance protein B
MRRSDQRRDAIFACYQSDVTGRSLAELLADARPFTRALAEGVEQHRERLDTIIADNLVSGWSLERLAPLDHNIMRVALFEILMRDDVPAEVAIDEAIEIAKRYCGSDSPAFINGVLGAVVEQLAPVTAERQAGGGK